MTLLEAIDDAKLVVVLGPGGSGKTTVASAIALALSRRKRTLLFAIDPSRTLQDALGLEVGARRTWVAPRLEALMLDSRAALGGLVERYAPDPETLRSIRQSPFYAHLSDAVAGSEEYVAMGSLFELVRENRSETIVVDTPPGPHAIDFLRVPSRLLRVFESGAVRLLGNPRTLRVGRALLSALSRSTSSAYVREVERFASTFGPMFLELEDRARRMERVLLDPAQTATILVSTPERTQVDDAARLLWSLKREGLLPVAVVANRVVPPLPLPSSDAPEWSEFAADVATARRGARLYEEMTRSQSEGRSRLQDLGPPLLALALRPEGIGGLQAIEQASHALCPEPPVHRSR